MYVPKESRKLGPKSLQLQGCNQNACNWIELLSALKQKTLQSKRTIVHLNFQLSLYAYDAFAQPTVKRDYRKYLPVPCLTQGESRNCFNSHG